MDLVKNIPYITNLNAILIEKWFCKTLINLALVNQKEVIVDFDFLLPIIFGNKSFEKPYGLNLANSVGQIIDPTKYIIEFSPLLNKIDSSKCELAGGLFTFFGIYFILLLPCSKERFINGKLVLNLEDEIASKNWDNLELFWHHKEIVHDEKKGRKQYKVQSIKFDWESVSSNV
jgi:hypothetical protein